MPDPFGYAILGAGRWGGILADILEGMGRRATVIGGIRRGAGETEEGHAERVAALIPPCANCVWIAVPPGPHSPALARLAVGTDRHVILEKPWPVTSVESRAIEALAAARGKRVAVHHQFPLLSAIEAAADRLDQGRGLDFTATFTLARASANGIPPLANLGSHLIAIWRQAFPAAKLGPIAVGYECGNARIVQVGSETIDFTRNDEPLIQRFIERFENPTTGARSVTTLVEAAEIATAMRSLERLATDSGSPNLEVWAYPPPPDRPGLRPQ